jgi:hypothetical protein
LLFRTASLHVCPDKGQGDDFCLDSATSTTDLKPLADRGKFDVDVGHGDAPIENRRMGAARHLPDSEPLVLNDLVCPRDPL